MYAATFRFCLGRGTRIKKTLETAHVQLNTVTSYVTTDTTGLETKERHNAYVLTV